MLEILVASEDATFGSVMAKADLIVPSNKGFNHFSFCASEPYLSKTSIFPASGAEELNTSAAQPTPIISAKGAYSRLLSP